jgi:cell division protein FtsL
MFTTHAPTVLNRLKQFDEKFEELREEAGTDAGSSRVSAIARIREELRR